MIAETETVLHSWCVQAQWNAPTIVGGEGARFWDESGRVYLDMSSLAECMNLGHQHPGLIRAIQQQAQSLCFVNSAWGAAPRAAGRRGLCGRAAGAGAVCLSLRAWIDQRRRVRNA